MLDATELRLRILESRDRVPGITGQSANVIVRRISRRLITRQDCLGFIIERRDDGLVRFRIAAEEAFGSECLEVQTIDEWAITFRRCSRSGEIDVVSVLNDRAGATS